MTMDNEKPKPLAPWEDLPSCPTCKKRGVLAHVPAEDNSAEEDEMPPCEELAALNDCDVQQWGFCMGCEEVVDVGPAGYRKAAKADEWWEREDRDEAWAELQRQRKVDEVAAEHARRQIPLFGAGS